MRRSPAGRAVLLTVYCGECAAEGRRRRGVLGVVTVMPGREPVQGLLAWESYDPRWGRARVHHSFADLLGGEEFVRLGVRDGRVLTARGIDPAPPPQLLGACQWHDTGALVTAEVLRHAKAAAAGQARDVVLLLNHN